MDRYPQGTAERLEALLVSRSIDWADVLTITEAGSTAHGISVGSDDLDFTVVRIESFDELVVGTDDRQSMMIRTKPEGERSEPGDIDLNVYTLRRFTRLAGNGNPTILMIVFAAESLRMVDRSFPAEELGEVTRSKRAGDAYLGYMRSQVARWITEAGEGSSRPELVEAHGFDTKFAAHAVRLGLQGIEYMTTGRISLPMPEDQASAIRDLRAGGMTGEDALGWVRELEVQLEDAVAGSTLPDHPDIQRVNAFVAEQYGARLRA